MRVLKASAVRTLLASLMCLLLCTIFSRAETPAKAPASAPQKPGELSIPAIFTQFIAPPGKTNNVKEPGRILFEPRAKELYIADLGNNRILIFDSNFVFRFEFSCNEHISAPMDIAVDGKGYVYALGMSPQGKRIVKFDFDGLFLSEYPVSSFTSGKSSLINTIAAADDGTLFLLDEMAHEVILLDTVGKSAGRFPVEGFISEKERKEMAYGELYLKDSLLFIPLSMLGTVAIYKRTGEYVRCVGTKGTVMGDLNFPVSVSINKDGLLEVLDRNRFNVVCFKLDGKFVGEFGGKGRNAGWFYFPNRLALNDRNQIIVGQVLNNSIQVCEPPSFLLPENFR